MSDKSTKSERRALAGSNSTTTYHQQAQVDQALEGTGRFSELARQERAARATVVGETPGVQYPRLPAGSPWARGPRRT